MPTKEQRPAAEPVTRLLGRVDRIGAKGYGFIRTDDHQEYFFHRRDVRELRLPRWDSLVTFQPIPQTLPGKKPRAIRIQILTEPSK